MNIALGKNLFGTFAFLVAALFTATVAWTVLGFLGLGWIAWFKVSFVAYGFARSLNILNSFMGGMDLMAASLVAAQKQSDEMAEAGRQVFESDDED